MVRALLLWAIGSSGAVLSYILGWRAGVRYERLQMFRFAKRKMALRKAKP